MKTKRRITPKVEQPSISPPIEAEKPVWLRLSLLSGRLLNLEVSATFAFAIFAYAVLPQFKLDSDDNATLNALVLFTMFLALGAIGLGHRIRFELLARQDLATTLRIYRYRGLLDAGIVALIVVQTLLVTGVLYETSERIASNLPLIRSFGTKAVEKFVDYVIGGSVFEVVRRVFSRMFPASLEVRSKP